MEKVYVYGVTAVGKTTLSKKLAQEKHIKYISGDAIKDKYSNSKAGKKDLCKSRHKICVENY